MNLKSRRESLGLTLEQAGRGIGGRQKVYRFESGERDPRRMRLDTAQRYADNLGVTLDALWELCQPDNAKSAPSGRSQAHGAVCGPDGADRAHEHGGCLRLHSRSIRRACPSQSWRRLRTRTDGLAATSCWNHQNDTANLPMDGISGISPKTRSGLCKTDRKHPSAPVSSVSDSCLMFAVRPMIFLLSPAVLPRLFDVVACPWIRFLDVAE